MAAQERRIRPQKHARRPEALPGGVRDDSVEAARHLLRVRHVVVIVDGYNVAKRGWPDLASLADQRDRLLDRLIGLHASTRAEFQIVFDGTQAGSIAASKGQPVTVLFTETGDDRRRRDPAARADDAARASGGGGVLRS